ncbi:hypothetical protein GCM10007170_27820 [Arthrobacter liuii]|uniref:Uncharacterized protein n=1 Tax=Arthrobacter liuii TaxID=1476996 RepID=A0ABQ2AY09_9MICC|nr:hypothetical protein GCM10007170_27820 [Arthrobacter liuii]
MVGSDDGGPLGRDVVQALDPGPEKQLDHRTEEDPFHDPIEHVVNLSGRQHPGPASGLASDSMQPYSSEIWLEQ